MDSGGKIKGKKYSKMKEHRGERETGLLRETIQEKKKNKKTANSFSPGQTVKRQSDEARKKKERRREILR